jgi:membrane protease YdiL (CAAX protease family)
VLSPVEIAVCVLAVGGLAYYVRATWRLGPCNWPAPGFGIGDYILNGLLVFGWLLLIASSLGKTINVTPELLVNNAIFNFFIVATILGFLIARNRNPVDLFGLRWKNWRKDLPLIAIYLVAIIPVLLAVSMLVNLALGGSTSSQDLLLFFQNSKSLTEKLLLIFTAVVVAPVTEELVFRGYLHGVLRQIGGRWCGILVNSLIFAGIHGHIPSLAGLFIFAIALSLIYERTGSLWANLVMHAGFNSFTLFVATVWPDLK